MTKRLFGLALTCLMAACGTVHVPPPNTQPVPEFAVAAQVVEIGGRPVPDATCVLRGTSVTTSASGTALFPFTIPADVPQLVGCSKAGYNERQVQFVAVGDTNIEVLLTAVTPAHFDPMSMSLDDLRAVRADFGIYAKGFENQCNDPAFGLDCNAWPTRGVQQGLVFSFDTYPREKRLAYYDQYTDGLQPSGKARDYTHQPIGPFRNCTGARGYHGVYGEGPCTGEQVNTLLREMWDHRVNGVARPIVPICFVFEDNDTEFRWPDGVDRSLCRIVVPQWEHDTADCGMQKAKALFPGALLFWHNPGNVFAPVGDACGPTMDGRAWYAHALQDYGLDGVLIQTDPWHQNVDDIAKLAVAPMIALMPSSFTKILFETDIYTKFTEGTPETQSLAYNDALLHHDAIGHALKGFGSGSTIPRAAPPVVETAVPADDIDLSQAMVCDSYPSEVVGWPATTTLQAIEWRRGGVHLEFAKQASWPELTPPGWTGSLQYTLWLGMQVNGTWHISGPMQYWKGLNEQGGDVTGFVAEKGTWQIPENWTYDCSAMRRQPQPGEPVAWFVTAGDQRKHNLFVVSERSNVVVAPFPASTPTRWQR